MGTTEFADRSGVVCRRSAAAGLHGARLAPNPVVQFETSFPSLGQPGKSEEYSSILWYGRRVRLQPEHLPAIRRIERATRAASAARESQREAIVSAVAEGVPILSISEASGIDRKTIRVWAQADLQPRRER
jgi:hypothetical protein